jgi:membrane protein
VTEEDRGVRLPDSVATSARRVGAIVERVLAIRPIGIGMRSFERYSGAGGGLLSRGLAFAILFALLPALLLITSLVGIFVSDDAARAEIASDLVAAFPPLASVLEGALNSALAAAPTVSLISLGMLVWSASGLLRAFDQAIGLVFREPPMTRGPIRMVILVVGAGILAVAGATLLVASTLPGRLGHVIDQGMQASFTQPLILFAAIYSAFRLLPNCRLTWRIVLPPALLTSVAISILTEAFALIGPLVFKSVEFYGAVGAVFLGIVWLQFGADIFLIGAAWTAFRAEEREAAAAAA